MNLSIPTLPDPDMAVLINRIEHMGNDLAVVASAVETIADHLYGPGNLAAGVEQASAGEIPRNGALGAAHAALDGIKATIRRMQEELKRLENLA